MALLLTGCASGSSRIPESASSTSQEKIHFELPDAGFGSIETTRRGTVSSDAIPLSVDETWPLLLQVYTALKLPVTTVDSKARLVGVNNKRLHQINGKRARSFFDCGLEYVTAGRDLYVLVRTQLEPNASKGTLARTQVDAYAKSNEGSGGVRCASTGALEILIATELQKAVQAQQP